MSKFRVKLINGRGFPKTVDVLAWEPDVAISLALQWLDEADNWEVQEVSELED